MATIKKGNIVLFPNVIERHLEKAFEAREKEDYEEAKIHLEQVVGYVPHHVSGLFGLMITYYDLQQYRDAIQIAENMIANGLGDYGEVLRIYIASFIQLEEYRQVCDVLTPVIRGNKVAPELKHEFQEILATCEMLLYTDGLEKENHNLNDQLIQEKLARDPDYLHQLLYQLEHGDFDQQLSALQQLKYIHSDEVTAALREYLLFPQPDPVLKTFALRSLKELGVTGTVFVHKFEQMFETKVEDVPLDELEMPEQERKVIELVAKMTYHQDPSFLSFAFQMWMEYLFSIYPLHPSIRNTAAWAAAVHYMTSKLLNKKQNQKMIAQLYGISVSSLSARYKDLDNILHTSLRMR